MDRLRDRDRRLGEARGDLLAGAPDEDTAAGADAGVANAIYGAATGLASAGAREIENVFDHGYATDHVIGNAADNLITLEEAGPGTTVDCRGGRDTLLGVVGDDVSNCEIVR